MNSIFSSYDAVCAELFGLTLRSSVGSVKKEDIHSLQSRVMKEARDFTPKKSSGGDSSSPRYSGRPQVKKTPRLAPELDGLSCFETLVPY